MRLAEKLLRHAEKAPAGVGADRDRPAETAARPIAAEADAGGVLTFGDVASAREGARGAATPGETAAAAARWSAGAVKRVGSVKFAAPARGANRGAGAQVDEDASDDNLARRRSVPRGEKHKHFPADYTLKTHVKFTSTAPLRWAALCSAGPAAADGGLRAFVGARTLADADADTNAAEHKSLPPLPPKERVHRACAMWQYPSSPMEPELIAALKKHPGTAGKRWLENRLEDGWRGALLSAYSSLRVGKCPLFYVVYAERVILFAEPGVGGGTASGVKAGQGDGGTTAGTDEKQQLGFAVVTDAASGKFRDALVRHKVPHTCVGHDPLAKTKKTGRDGFTGLSGKHGAAGDGRGHGGAYGHGIPLEEWAQEDGNEAYDGEDDFQALDQHGKPMLRSPERLARLNGLSAVERDLKAADNAVVCIGAAAVHALICLLTESSETAGNPAGAASASQDAPLIVAPAPFANASLKAVELKVTRAETTFEVENEGEDEGEDGEGQGEDDTTGTTVPGKRRREHTNPSGKPKREKRTVYVAECVTQNNFPIPPWCVSRLTEALCDEQGEHLVGNFRALPSTAALNAAVASISRKERTTQGDDAADAEINEETFYTLRERKRTRRSTKLGTKGLERVERQDGVWYVNPTAEKKLR